MDIGNIDKIENEKRMKEEAEKLSKKVSRETAKIIKLKVAQDTAYWDLKEKLQQVEGNHERLQQNMVEVQMQNETISGLFQDELRLRSDTLNKLSNTRMTCEDLEDYSERLKKMLSCCKADQSQSVLREDYEKSGQLVRETKVKKVQDDEKSRQIISGLEDKDKLTSEHPKQLLHLLTSPKPQADSDIANLRQKLETIQKQKEDLVESVNELNRKLDLCNFNIEKKDETISNLQREIKQLITQKVNAQSSEAKKILMKEENDLKEALQANSLLKRSLAHQEQFTQSICEQKNNLEEKIAVLEEDQQNSRNELERLRSMLAEATLTYENQKKDIATLINEKELLLNYIKDKEQNKEEIEKLKKQMQQIKNEKDKIKSELDKNVEESRMKSVRIDELMIDIEALLKNIEEIENTYKKFKVTSEEKIKELSDIIEARDKELDSKASSITQLMSQLETSTDIRSKLETALQKIMKEIDIERDGVKENEREMNAKIEQLEAVVRDKEEELSKQMPIILEMRNENERLQDQIQGMQNMIDNFQKELTGLTAPAPHLQPEQDDNAVMLTPGPKKTQPPTSTIIQNSQFAGKRKDPKLDPMFFNMFSDSSMEGDTLDKTQPPTSTIIQNSQFAGKRKDTKLDPMFFNMFSDSSMEGDTLDKTQPPTSTIIQNSQFAGKRKDPKLDPMFFNMFSDSSMEGDTLDKTQPPTSTIIQNSQFAGKRKDTKLDPMFFNMFSDSSMEGDTLDKTQPPTSTIIQNSQFAGTRKDPKLDPMFFNMFSDSSMEGDTLDKTQPPTSTIIQNSQFAGKRNDPKLDPMFFNMFSDSSMEGDTLDATEVNRRFLAMSRGEPVSSMPLGSLKRRSSVPIHSSSKVKPAQHCDAIPFSQVKNDMKNKERKFFKTKRGDNKNKKIK